MIPQVIAAGVLEGAELERRFVIHQPHGIVTIYYRQSLLLSAWSSVSCRPLCRYLQTFSKAAALIKKHHRNRSDCDGALLLVEFGIRNVADTDHGLQRQSHAELETDGEGC